MDQRVVIPLSFGAGMVAGAALEKEYGRQVPPAPVPGDLADAAAKFATAVAQLQETAYRLASVADRLGAVADSLARIQPAQNTLVNLPVDPTTLSKIVQGFSVPGETEFPLYSMPVLAPSNTKTTFNVLMPAGFVGMVVEPIQISSTYYGMDLYGDVVVDEIRKVTPLPYYFTGPASISLGEWYVVRQKITIVMYNYSPNSVTMTVQAQVALLQNSFYEEWFRVVLRASWEAMNDLVERMGGRRR